MMDIHQILKQLPHRFPFLLVDRVLEQVGSEHGGGWRVPAAARAGVGTAYRLFAVGLLADQHPEAAAALAAQVVAPPVATTRHPD